MATNPILYQKNYLYYLLSLSLLAVAQVGLLHYYFQMPYQPAGIDAALSWFLLGALAFGIVNTFSFYHPARGKSFILLALPALGAWVLLKFSSLLLRWWIGEPEYLLLIDNSQLYRFTVFFFLLLAATGFSLLWYRLEEKDAQQRRKEEVERMSREAELFKLRQQLQPHFLFNSLNSINSLVGRRPEEARRMVQQLSEFLRGTLRRDEQRFIPLSDELRHLRLYLDIEQLRFGHRLKVEIDCEEHCQSVPMPPLLLQPLLENAIKFGLYGTTGDLLISLRCSLERGHLIIGVSNPYDEDGKGPEGTGFGLKSVKRRLYLLFGRTDLLQVHKSTTNFTVNLKIPRIDDQSTDN